MSVEQLKIDLMEMVKRGLHAYHLIPTFRPIV